MEKDKLPPNPSASSSRSFSHDVSRMPENPSRMTRGHRRAQSEIISLPDNLDLVDPADYGPSFSDEMEEEEEEDLLSMYLDMEKIGNIENPSLQNVENAAANMQNVGSGRVRHQHSQSMDGSSSSIIKEEALFEGVGDGHGSIAEAKKAISAAKLADLALVDPKRAKRIWANRQSAARSKERKMRYIAELERKVQTLQTEATTLSAQLTMLQRDTTGLTAENSELKVRLQTMEQQVCLQDALNDALREEVQRLKMATGQMIPNGPMANYGQSFGANQQFYNTSGNNNNNSNNQAMQSLLAARQLQQLQIRPQHYQQQLPQVDMRMRGSMVPQNQRESSAERN